jgi:SAM-dependent methyltransferase
MGSLQLSTAPPARGTASEPSRSSLLLSDEPLLDLDALQRGRGAARLVERLLIHAPRPVRVLEVGAEALLPRFLNPDRTHVVRRDAEPDEGPDAPLPFGDASFDCVVAIDVLEHVPEERRRDFLIECLRVARHGFVFSCPDASPDVLEAEALADAAYRRRHGTPHPELREHRLFGLPRQDDVLRTLREFDVPHAVLDNAPLDTWLAGLLLADTLRERHASPALRRRCNEILLQAERPGAKGYRKVFVCARSFDATGALDLPRERTAGPDGGAAVAALHHLAAAIEALAAD